jgi:hypothetical protein
MSRFDVQQDGHTRPVLPDRTHERGMCGTRRESPEAIGVFWRRRVIFWQARAGTKDGKLLLNGVSAGFGKEIQAGGILMRRCPLRIRLHIGLYGDGHEFEKRAGGQG